MDQLPENLPVPAPVPVQRYVPTLTVVSADGKEFKVPTTPDANRALGQITVSRLRDQLEKLLQQMEKSGEVPDLKALKVIAEIIKINEDTAALVYGQRRKSPSEEVISDFAALAGAVAKGAAEGARVDHQQAKLTKIKSLGRQVGGKVVEAEVVPEQPAQ